MAAPAQILDYEYVAASTTAYGQPSFVGQPQGVPKQRYVIQSVPYANTIFRLLHSIEISFYPENGTWICECPTICSLVHGDTLSAAVLAFCEDFAVLWDEIGKAPDDTLAPDAQRLKATFRSLVRAVEKVG